MKLSEETVPYFMDRVESMMKSWPSMNAWLNSIGVEPSDLGNYQRHIPPTPKATLAIFADHYFTDDYIDVLFKSDVRIGELMQGLLEVGFVLGYVYAIEPQHE